MALALYALCVVLPFLVFVVGFDRRRCDPKYDWFNDAAQADVRRLDIRFGVYWPCVIVAYVLGA